VKLRVAVIYGGRSGEHEVSLRSAKSVMDALDPEKYKVIQYFISKEGRWRPRPADLPIYARGVAWRAWTRRAPHVQETDESS